jgi:ectoine hydroxylase
MTIELSTAQQQAFQEDGFLFLRGFFPQREIASLSKIARVDEAYLTSFPYASRDSRGQATQLFVWSHLKDDAYSAYARHERIVTPWAQLLGGPVTYFHHKMMLKQPGTKGAWEWHQDYGYYYRNYLRADMGGTMIAIDPAYRSNGCLQLMRGSHRCGRLEHTRLGDQSEHETMADPTRVEALMARCERVYCEMEPGDVLFFHSNTLHHSEPNPSNEPRWALITNFTRKDNPPIDAPNSWGSNFEAWDAGRVADAVRRHSARQR